MSDKFVKKNIKLILEFNRYTSGRPNLIMKIPNKSTVFFTVKGDDNFNKESRSLAERMKTRKYKKIVEARKEGARWKILSPTVV